MLRGLEGEAARQYFIKRMSELGYVIIGSSPEQMTAMQRAEQTRWAPVVKASGASAD